MEKKPAKGPKNLLIITAHYPDKRGNSIGGVFVKEQVKYLKEHFDKVKVLVPTVRNPRILWQINKMMPKTLFSTYSKVIPDYLFKDYGYDNVSVKYLRYFHIPADFFRKRAGEHFFDMIKKELSKDKIKYDLCHAHFSYPAGYAGAKVSKVLKIPTVLTIHEDADWFASERESDDPNLRYAWSNVDMIIRVNKNDVNTLKKYNKVSRLKYISNGFDADKFKIIDKNSARKKLGLSRNKKIFVNVAALVEQKNHENLLEAIRIAAKKRKDLRFVIIGEGPLKELLIQKIKDMKLENYVELIGGKPHAQIPFWLGASDGFVLSSNSEGNPTVMFEALGCGRPYIGTEVGGVSQIITSNKYGYTCAPKNPKALSNIILKACDTDWSAEEISKYSRVHSWKAVSEKIFEAYAELLKSNKKVK